MPELADLQQGTQALPEIADIQSLSGAEQASTQPSAPTTPATSQQPTAQPPPPPTTAVPDPTNPDAPQQSLVDPNTGQATTDYGKALQYVTAFDQYVKGGGDISKFNQDDFDGLQAAVDSIPGFENETSSPSVMYARFREGKEKNLAVDAGRQGILPTAVNVLTAPSTAMAILGAGKDLLWNTTKFVFDKTIGAGVPAIQDIGDILHGDFSMSHTQDLQARQTNALVETVADKWQQYGQPAVNTIMNVGGSLAKGDFGAIPGEITPQGVKDLNSLYGLASARATAANPDQAAQLDFKQSEIIRGQIARDQQTQANITGARDQVADVYKWLGAGDFAQRMMTQQPDQSDMYVLGMALDPTTYLAGPAESMIKGTGEKIAGSFIKTGFRTAAIEESGAAVSAVEQQLSGVNAARTNLISILSGDGRPLDDVTRSGFENNLQRLNSVQSNLSAERADLLGQHQDAIAAVNKQMDQAAKASPFREAVGGLMQVAGGVGELPGQIGNWMASIPKGVVDTFMPTAPDEVKAAVVSSLKGWGQVALGAAGAAMGAPHGIEGIIAGITGGGLVGKVAGGTLDMLQHFSHDIRTVGEQFALGQQTLPFWKQMSEQLHGVPSWLASKMDNPLVYSIPAQVTGAIAGGTLMGGQALIAGGGNTQKFQQGLGSGMVIGAAGGGLGQLSRFNSPAELRQMAIGDRGRFLDSLTQPNKDLYLKLHPDYQLALASYGMAHPDLAMQFENNPGASNGSYSLNPNPIAKINIAADNPLAAVASHEVAHHIAAHQLGDTVDSYIRGNPITGQTGIMSALGPDGKPMLQPVVDATGQPTGKMEYVPNAQFENYKADYNARKLRDNPGQPPENDYGIAQEMFAELHAEHLTNREALQKVARGYVPSDLVSENVVSNWLTKMGVGADPTTGNPIPTSTLQGAKGLQDVINNYYRQRQYKKLPLETGTERGGTPVEVGQIVKGTPEFDRIQTNLNASGDLHRNPDGTIAVDLSGRPRVKTPRQADADAAQMGQRIHDLYQRQPGLEGTDNDNYLKVVTDRDGRQFRRGQRVPDAVFNELAASNQFNSNQLLNWRKMDGMMQRNDGSMMNTVYNTASKGKGKYATLPARERDLVPIYSEVSLHNDQVNIKAYDPELLQANLNKKLRGKTGQDLYNGNIGPAYADVRTYLDNLAAGRPGETGLGPERKGFVNELFGFNADANPFVNELTKRSPDVFKSFRLDRINRLAEIPGSTEPFHAATYEQVRSFMQPRNEPVAAGADVGAQYQPSGAGQGQGEVTPARGTQDDTTRFQPRAGGKIPPPDLPPDDTAIPVSYRRTSTGKIQPVQHALDITRAPLIAGKEPPEIPTGKKGAEYPNDFEHIKFLSEPEQKQLTHLNDASAVTTYADKLVDEFHTYQKHPMSDTILSAKNWYTDVKGILEAGFGKHAELFSHLLAATSSGQSVIQNFKDAREAFEQWRAGKYDDAIDQYKNTGKITEDMKPVKENGAKFGRNSDAVLKVLAGTWLDKVEGPKTPNFFDNLFGKGTRATIDVWAGRTMRRLGFEGVEGAPKRWRLQPKSEGGVSNLEFAFSQEAFDQAAKKLGMDASALQAVHWYGEKVHWADKKYSKGGTAAALESYIPQLKEYAQQRQEAGLVEQ